MYCRNCGNKIEDGCKFCPNCGAAVTPADAKPDAGTSGNPFSANFSPDNGAAPPPQSTYPPEYNYGGQSGEKRNPGDSSSFGWGLLGFFIPLAGLILYLVWKDEYPLRAKSAGKGALAAVIIYVVIVVLYVIIAIAIIGAAASSASAAALALAAA